MLSWKDISDLIVSVEQYLIASLKRNLAGHKRWEKDEGFDWPAWQAEKLKHIERFRKENKSVIDEYSDVIDLETRGLMADQFMEGIKTVDNDAAGAWTGKSSDAWKNRGDSVTQRMWNRKNQKLKPSEDNFFGVNDRRLEKLMQDMHEAEQKAETAALRMMDDVYRRTISQAATTMATGATTLPQAIDMAVKAFLKTGINCIEYSNGTRVNIADYVQMALRTAATRSFLQGEAKRRAELGIDTVLVSQYGACSNTCLPWQGRVYIDDVWGEFSGEVSGDRGKSVNGNWYPLLSVAVKNGLFHPNCRHTITTWFEGVSKLPNPMDTAKIKENSVLEQQQRAMEKKIRMFKRLAEGVHEQTLAKEYKQKATQAQKELREFIAEHDDVLRREYWREKTYGAGIQQNVASDFEPTAVPFNENATFEVKLPSYSEAINQKVSSAVKEVARLGSIDKKEHLILVNTKNGRMEYMEDSADSGSVGGNDFFEFISQHPNDKFSFVHNHPSGKMLSYQDMLSYFSNNSLDSFIACGHNGKVYAAYGEKKKLPAGNAVMESLNHDDELLKDLRIAKKEGKIDSIDFQHAAERARVKYMLETFSNYMEVET